MIELVATAESVEQAKQLVDIGIDIIYIGNDDFGLRLPTSFSYEEIKEITTYAHEHHKQVRVAVNTLMHNEHIKKVEPYLEFLASIQVDEITIGDPGVVRIIKTKQIKLPFVYDAQTMVTSANQVNFWVRRGAAGAILARELTYTELKAIKPQVSVPVEILVYGATCIFQSKRSLVENYFNFTESKQPSANESALFLSEMKKADTHYSIYEDTNGTHVFATEDMNLLPQMDKLVKSGLTRWKLDGLFTKGDNFVSIAKLFIEAKQAFAENKMTTELMKKLNETLQTYHPSERKLGTGFFLKDPNDVK